MGVSDAGERFTELDKLKKICYELLIYIGNAQASWPATWVRRLHGGDVQPQCWRDAGLLLHTQHPALRKIRLSGKQKCKKSTPEVSRSMTQFRYIRRKSVRRLKAATTSPTIVPTSCVISFSTGNYFYSKVVFSLRVVWSLHDTTLL